MRDVLSFGGLRKHERGSVVIIASGIFALLGCCGAIATDLGMIYFERREAQGAVDLAALSAVVQLGDADKIVNTVLSENGVPKYSALQITTGRYLPNAAIAPADRFVAGAAPPNAVRVALRKEAPLYFGKSLLSKDSVEIGVEAIATATDMAEFSIGSRLLSLDGGVANALLSSMLGTSVSLRAVDYRSLANADLDLFKTFDALATDGAVDAVTYQDVLDGDIEFSDFVDAMAAAAGADPDIDAAAIEAIDDLASSVSGVSTEINLADMIDAGPYGATAVGSDPASLAQAPMLSTVMAAAALANGTNQVAVDLGASIPGVLTARLYLRIGERPQGSGWIAVGPEGTTISTAQVRLGLMLEAGGSGLLSHLRIELPVLAEVAQASARLSDISCDGITPEEVSVATRPGIANAWIGRLSPLQLEDLSHGSVHPGRIIDTPIFKVSGRAHAELADEDPETLIFSAEDIEAQRVRTATTSEALESLASSLVDDLSLEVRAFGIPLDPRATSVLRDQLDGLAEPADDVLNTIFELFGIGIGEADVIVHGARCGGPGLVG